MTNRYVSSGNVESRTLASGDQLHLFDSATASYTDVENGASFFVYSGGFAYGSTLDGGVMDVSAGGTASYTSLDGGELTIATGGTANVVMQYGGSMIIAGSANDVSFVAPGSDLVLAGGVQTGAVVSGGAAIYVHGTDSDALVAQEGSLVVAGTGVDTGAYVVNAGTMEVGFGGRGNDVNVTDGGLVLALPGGTIAGTVSSGGNLIAAGGDISSLVVQSGGRSVSKSVAIYTEYANTLAKFSQTDHATVSTRMTEFVLSGGVAEHTLLEDGGTEYVFSGGTAAGGSVISGAVQNQIIAYAGGIVSGVTIESGIGVGSGGTFYAMTITGESFFLPVGGLNIGSGVSSDSVLLNGGYEEINGGVAFNTTVEAEGTLFVAGGTTSQGGIITGSAVSTTILSGGTEMTQSGGVASFTTIAGGMLILGNDSDYEGDVSFTGTGGLLSLELQDDPLTPAPIKGFATGDTIAFSNLTYNAQDSVAVDQPNTVTITAGDLTYSLDIEGATSTTPFYLTSGTGKELLLLESAPCFAAGTRILTPRGEIAVEALRVGDIVITSTGEDAAITWIGRRRIDLTRHPKPENAQPIRIAADALADGVPSRDLILSPDHALFLNHVLIPAKTLINHRNVQQLNRRAVTYHHIELAAHAIIFAENCAVETYLETGNRGAFENAAGALTLHPDFAQTLREQQSCAPFVTTGPAVDAATEQLARQYYTTRTPVSVAAPAR